jgi:hypothetical protein
MVLIQFRPGKAKRETHEKQQIGKGTIIFFPVRYPELEERSSTGPLLSGFATYRHLSPYDDKKDHPE